MSEENKTEALALRKNELEVMKMEIEIQETQQTLSLQRADFLVTSGVLPEGLRDKGTAMILCDFADRTGYPLLAIAQNAVCIKGALSFQAKFVSACIKNSDAIDGRLHYELGSDHETNTWENLGGKVETATGKTGKNYNRASWKKSEEDGLYVIVSGTVAGESEPTELKIYFTQATVRNSTLWANDPGTQLMYFATKRWASINCPDIILGMDTPDDIIQVNDTTTLETSKAKGSAGFKSRIAKHEAQAETIPDAETIDDEEPEEIELFYGATMTEIEQYFAEHPKSPHYGIKRDKIRKISKAIIAAGKDAQTHFNAWKATRK